MILYNFTHNIAVQALHRVSSTQNPEGFRFYNESGQIRYVLPDDRGMLLCLDVNLRRIDHLYLHYLFDQPDNEWQRDPGTGQRLRYRYLHPVEYVFE